jgi:two-component system chemotaxis response regulator CheY
LRGVRWFQGDAATAVPGTGEGSGMKTVTCRSYSILITDDDSGSREALRELVEPEGYRTFLASSGEEAVDIVREEKIHLALLDLHMPRLTGLETVQLVHEINDVLPCILVTADATQDVMRQAFTVRAYSVIPKPVSKNVLLYTVVRALMKAYGNLLQKEQDHT